MTREDRNILIAGISGIGKYLFFFITIGCMIWIYYAGNSLRNQLIATVPAVLWVVCLNINRMIKTNARNSRPGR